MRTSERERWKAANEFEGSTLSWRSILDITCLCIQTRTWFHLYSPYRLDFWYISRVVIVTACFTNTGNYTTFFQPLRSHALLVLYSCDKERAHVSAHVSMCRNRKPIWRNQEQRSLNRERRNREQGIKYEVIENEGIKNISLAITTTRGRNPRSSVDNTLKVDRHQRTHGMPPLGPHPS